MRHPFPTKHETNRKKKEYVSEHVNGFGDSLRQNSQMVHNGAMTTTDRQEIREETAVALKKVRWKEDDCKENWDGKFPLWKPGHGIADWLADLENQDTALECVTYQCGSTDHETTRCRAKGAPALGGFPFTDVLCVGDERLFHTLSR